MYKDSRLISRFIKSNKAETEKQMKSNWKGGTDDA
ncbi:hypothetical protein ALTERO38_20383 [Alteromonas sp. 38]|nr:hypothetical protein ALTER154_100153 [Alteromonas sp. 154]VXB07824.1 hypothetical protein ALTERO38_20383 [Alteromonas sp. 38]